MADVYMIAAVGLVAVVTMFDRGLPYLLFGGKKNMPKIVSYLGKVLPAAIMIILVVYFLRNINYITFPHGLPELISVIIVAIMQIIKRNSIISIIAGTACYMILIRTVLST